MLQVNGVAYFDGSHYKAPETGGPEETGIIRWWMQRFLLEGIRFYVAK